MHMIGTLKPRSCILYTVVRAPSRIKSRPWLTQTLTYQTIGLMLLAVANIHRGTPGGLLLTTQWGRELAREACRDVA
jgi:hypothetical protein